MLTLLGARNVRSNPGNLAAPLRAERFARHGVAAVEHGGEVVGVDQADQAECLALGAEPVAGRLARARVVVLDARNDLRQVVVGAVRAEPADVEHQRRRATTAPPQAPHEGHDPPRNVVEPHPAQTTERPRTSGKQRKSAATSGQAYLV